jgi:hypothetical protein
MPRPGRITIDGRQQVLGQRNIHPHGPPRRIGAHQNPSSLDNIRIGLDSIQGIRLRNRLPMFGGQIDMRLQRLLGVQRGLMRDIASAGATGEIGGLDPISFGGFLDDGRIIARHTQSFRSETPDCRSILRDVPGGTPWFGCATVVVLGRAGCRKRRWLPVTRTRIHPWASSLRITARLSICINTHLSLQPLTKPSSAPPLPPSSPPWPPSTTPSPA